MMFRKLTDEERLALEMEERAKVKKGYDLKDWGVTIYAQTEQDFYQIYDTIMEKVSNNKLNKRWYRSFKRTLMCWTYGKTKHFIPFK